MSLTAISSLESASRKLFEPEESARVFGGGENFS